MESSFSNLRAAAETKHRRTKKKGGVALWGEGASVVSRTQPIYHTGWRFILALACPRESVEQQYVNVAVATSGALTFRGADGSERVHLLPRD